MPGSIKDWSQWTGLDFPANGEYIIPGALNPVCIKDGQGVYIEPNVWMHHVV